MVVLLDNLIFIPQIIYSKIAMKRIVSILLLVSLASFSCSSGDENPEETDLILGIWNLEETLNGGQNINSDYTIEFKSTFIAVVTYISEEGGQNSTEQGEWELSDNELTITLDDPFVATIKHLDKESLRWERYLPSEGITITEIFKK